MEWYQVVKTIHGRKYLYWQKTYRVGGSVKTLNKYIGPYANPPRMQSLKATIANLPDWHRDLRARYDDDQITKADYLELLSKGPHVHSFTWQMAPDENGNTYEVCECGKIGRVERTKTPTNCTWCGKPNDRPEVNKVCIKCADDIPW